MNQIKALREFRYSQLKSIRNEQVIVSNELFFNSIIYVPIFLKTKYVIFNSKDFLLTYKDGNSYTRRIDNYHLSEFVKNTRVIL